MQRCAYVACPSVLADHLLRGLRPTWALATSVFAVVGGTVLTAVQSDLLWVLVAGLAVLLLGDFSTWDAADRRASAAELKATRTDLLEKQNAELAKKYAVSQAQYKVFEAFAARTAARAAELCPRDANLRDLVSHSPPAIDSREKPQLVVSPRLSTLCVQQSHRLLYDAVS